MARALVRLSKGKGEGVQSGRATDEWSCEGIGRGSRRQPRPARDGRGLSTVRAREGWGTDRRAGATVPQFKLIQTGQIYFKSNSNIYE
jgi:hypothetical protein